MRVSSIFASAMLLCTPLAMSAQDSQVQAVASAVPNLIKFSGTLVDHRGYPIATPVDVTFSLYADQATEGHKALWKETQRLSPNEKGAYTAYLGAGSSNGLPSDVFTTSKAQWLGVAVEGEAELPRVLLVSVPYAFKAGDAQTLGGLPASAYALAGTRSLAAATAVSAPETTPSVSPDVTSTVTTTGGTSKYLPVFSGSNTIVNSEIYDTGKSVGIGDIPNPSARLDVNGTIIMRGNMIVSRAGNATTAKGFPSYAFQFFSNMYNSSSHATDNDYFALQSEPVGNNTSNPSATFNLTYSKNGSGGETGWYINSKGIMHFAPGQTFPGTGTGTITGVTAGTGLSGGGTSGAITLKNTGLLGLTAGSGIKSTGGQTPSVSVDSSVVPFLNNFPIFTDGAEVTGNYLWANSTGANRTALYAYSTSTDSTTPTAQFTNFDTTSAGDLVFEALGANTGDNCTIDVSGNLFCTGTLGPALRKANNTTVGMYSVSSAENWVEDFGQGRLVNGVAVVQVSSDLADAISADANYHVFPTPNGDCLGLYVTKRTATTFEVHELQGGRSNVEFDYRIIAHRKGFESVRLPNVSARTHRLGLAPVALTAAAR